MHGLLSKQKTPSLDSRRAIALPSSPVVPTVAIAKKLLEAEGASLGGSGAV